MFFFFKLISPKAPSCHEAAHTTQHVQLNLKPICFPLAHISLFFFFFEINAVTAAVPQLRQFIWDGKLAVLGTKCTESASQQTQPRAGICRSRQDAAAGAVFLLTGRAQGPWEPASVGLRLTSAASRPLGLLEPSSPPPPLPPAGGSRGPAQEQTIEPLGLEELTALLRWHKPPHSPPGAPPKRCRRLPPPPPHPPPPSPQPSRPRPPGGAPPRNGGRRAPR